MDIAIVKYNAGNTQSVIFALERLGIQPILTADKEILSSADKVIFPGVGEASSTMQHLYEYGLSDFIPLLRQPVLGICLGLQLMCRHSEEGDTNGLGIFDIDVKKFSPGMTNFKVPHIGWNDFTQLDSPLFEDISMHDHVYFVHSYYAELCEHTIATCDYIQPFSAALHRDNFYAVQFHPEKSADIGQKILENFLKL
jgi:glutamine amidotransferase